MAVSHPENHREPQKRRCGHIKEPYPGLLLILIVITYVIGSAQAVSAMPQPVRVRPFTFYLEEGEYVSSEPLDTFHTGSPEDWVYGALEFYGGRIDCDRLGVVLMIDEEARAQFLSALYEFTGGCIHGVSPKEIGAAIVRKVSNVVYEPHDIFLVPAKVEYWDSPDGVQVDTSPYIDAAIAAANWTRGAFIGWQFIGLDYYVPIYQDILVLMTTQKIGDGIVTLGGRGYDCYSDNPWDSIALLHLQFFYTDWHCLAHEIAHILGTHGHHADGRNCVIDVQGYQWGNPRGYGADAICSDCLANARYTIGVEYIHPPPPFDPTKIF